MKYVLVFSLILMMSCEPQKASSNKENPLEDIAWIKEYIENTEKSPFPTKAKITQYKFNGEVVYLVNGCVDCTDAPSILYNKKKEQLCVFGGLIANSNNCPDFLDKASDKKVIWKSFD
ncbi:DUF6970 domain-containing protein [Tenacibaculum sp. MEBiC06402]|uniref:DUF6970 domain-containing protein n=1 Tax=unclassified Tenacibaculum TaxID=2635139 RepID=UPI003B99F9C7